jgi:RNA polymerase sigma-70 factor (ECF subfamily)
MVMRTVYITQFRREKKRNTVCIGDISEPSFSEKLELEGREFIQKVLENVPKHQRDVLEMSIFGDLSYAEIAERLKIPEGTVMSRRHRGVRLARAEYERISA